MKKKLQKKLASNLILTETKITNNEIIIISKEKDDNTISIEMDVIEWLITQNENK